MTRAKKKEQPTDIPTRTEVIYFEHNGATVAVNIKRIDAGDNMGAIICPRCGELCHELHRAAYELWCPACIEATTLKQLSLFGDDLT